MKNKCCTKTAFFLQNVAHVQHFYYFCSNRDTVVEYLKYLGDAKVLNLLYSDKKKIGKLTKPDKVYLENPKSCMLWLLRMWK